MVACGLGEAMTNFGEDIQNALFFTDLESVQLDNDAPKKVIKPTQERPSAPFDKCTKSERRDVFKPLGSHVDDASTVNGWEIETPKEKKCRALTIPPPAMARQKALDKARMDADRMFHLEQQAEKRRLAMIEEVSQASISAY